jgi:hypothetical protein
MSADFYSLEMGSSYYLPLLRSMDSPDQTVSLKSDFLPRAHSAKVRVMIIIVYARCLYNKVRYRGRFCVSCHVTGGGAYTAIFALRRQVSLSSVPKVQLNASKNSDTWRRSAKISL